MKPIMNLSAGVLDSQGPTGNGNQRFVVAETESEIHVPSTTVRKCHTITMGIGSCHSCDKRAIRSSISILSCLLNVTHETRALNLPGRGL